MSITISVVIPVYNSSEYIARTIESVLAQTHKPDEIIVVDNNSTDGTIEIIKQYPVTLLQENEVRSSYAARNKGIDHARSEIIAFIDADCIAADNWLKEGVTALQSGSADLAGGKVEFFFTGRKTTAQIWDSLAYLNVKSNIEKESSAPTANLFVKSAVFEKIGDFDQNVRSGGDFLWTKKAVDSGYSLKYAPKAIVKHPTRKLKDLLKKNFRIGTGYSHQRIIRGFSFWHEVPYAFYRLLFVSVPLSYVRQKLEENNVRAEVAFWKILSIAYLCRMTSRLGSFVEIIHILFKKRKNNIG